MRHLLFFTLVLLSIPLFSQESQVIQDPEAGRVLERVAAKTRSLQTLKTDFELVIEDRKEKTRNSSQGQLTIKQKKYRLFNEGSRIFFDGRTMWTYVEDNNEVTITEPQDNTGNFLSNPSTFFDSYQDEFKYRYVRETIKNGIPCHEIDLFPKNLNQPYSRIKVFINKNTDLPASISSIGKDGIDYTVNLKNLVLNQPAADSEFVFNPSAYKKVEVVDMRGL